MYSRTATLRMPQRRVYGPSQRTRILHAPKSAAGSLTWSAREIFYGIVAFSLLAFGLWSQFAIKTASAQLDALERDANRMQVQNQTLLADEKQLMSDAQLAKLGKKLGLHPAKTEQRVPL